MPFADAMLVPVPDDIDPLKLASASDNMPDAWRSVGPALAQRPGAPVLVVGGGARSIGLYAAGMAVALGASRVDYVDYDPERLRIAEALGASAMEIKRGASWFVRNAPRVNGPYLVSVDASSTAAGLRYALRSLAPGGSCTAVGFYFAKRTSLPLMQMYANSTTMHVGISHPRRDLPDVIELVRQGIFDPLKVATLVADWNDAPDAFTTRTTKVIVAREPYGRLGGN
ncbi:zinc-binding dehydrogenase [Rhodanobacter sp. C01]|uniref:zinc-binding dehydrogenase n=1 Tax=Rhodanobacter sp. C01 TaxID=1945856 RepID=UPI001C2CBA94|nr:zinc-binding dehydrogenase [Rhodanobacter sp. C01]